jgi:hypothetical protein
MKSQRFGSRRVADAASVGFVWSLKFIERHRTLFFYSGEARQPGGVFHQIRRAPRHGAGPVSAVTRFQTPPESDEPTDHARLRGAHGVERVLRRENMGQLRQQKSEVHEVSPGVLGTQHAEARFLGDRTPHFAEADVYRIASARYKRNVYGRIGQLSLSGISTSLPIKMGIRAYARRHYMLARPA